MTRRHPQQRLTLDAILPHLRKVRRLPDGSYMACCPAHDDENPSLRLFTYPTYRYPIPAGLWRLPEWGDADTIYLCEGETDMLTLWHADRPALGIQGADKWRAEWWQYLPSFPQIVLIPDNDEAGGQLVQKLAETCPDHLRERVYVLRLPEGVKDANELWQQVRGLEDPARFREALAQCVVQPLTAIPTETEFVLQLGHAREREVAHTLVPNLLYAERITILAGESGVGKTTFVLEIADALTRTGKLWGNTVEVPRGRVLWLDFDHRWERLQEIMDAYYGEGERELYTLAPEHPVPLEPQTLPAYRRAIERYGMLTPPSIGWQFWTRMTRPKRGHGLWRAAAAPPAENGGRHHQHLCPVRCAPLGSESGRGGLLAIQQP